jgi:hypothetical protein
LGTSFELGYRRGREAGWENGRIEGRKERARNRLLHTAEPPPLRSALIVTPSVELPSLEIILLQPFRHLKKLGIYQYEICTEDDIKMEYLKAASIVIFLRTVEPPAFESLLIAHQLGKETVYVIDDNFLEIPPHTSVSSYYNDTARRQTFQNFLRHASLVKVDSTFFADYICLYYNPRVACFQSSVDFDLIDGITKPASSQGRITIGYGGTQKDEDFSPVVPALLRVLRKYGGYVRLQFHGYIPGALMGLPFVSYREGQLDYQTYLQNLKRSDWDIGIAPLHETIFNFCKTNNKYREYAACLIPGIYSQCPPYTDWVKHGQTGYMVSNNEDSWFNGLCEMIDNASLREMIKVQAGAASKQTFQVDMCARHWREQILHI